MVVGKSSARPMYEVALALVARSFQWCTLSFFFAPKDESKRKSKREIMDELIAKSKFFKVHP